MERRELLIGELRHRVGNLFSLVQALHRQTGQSAKDAHDLEMRFGARLASLAGAHTLILDGGWQRTSLRSLLQTTLAPYIERVEFTGTDVRCRPRPRSPSRWRCTNLRRTPTNTARLSEPDGRLLIDTAVRVPTDSAASWCLSWKEKDGPPPPEAETEGFGTQADFDRWWSASFPASVARDWKPTGCTSRIEFPIS